MTGNKRPKHKRDKRVPREGGRRAVSKVQIGSKVRDTIQNKVGVVLDSARQYAHPQARPVFSYLVRWQDGLVVAVSEEAFRRGHGFVLLDEG